MEPITHYVSSDGTRTPIAELNNFHLLNALCKVSVLATAEDPAVAGDNKDMQKALKEEVLKRTTPAAKVLVQPEEIKAVYVGAVLMPNGEVICQGKTIGWFDGLKEFIIEAK